MENRKIILGMIIILIIIILLVIALMFLLKTKEDSNTQYLPNEIIPIEEIEIEIDSTIQRENNRNQYYIAQTCVKKFWLYYMDLFTEDELIEDKQEYEKQISEMLYGMLDTDYINFKQITKDNIKQKLPELKDSTIDITDIYVSQQNEILYYYFVTGTLREKQTSTITDFQMMLKIDMGNKTFEVFLQDYIKEKGYNNLTIGEQITLPTFDKVENKTYNTFDYQNISDKDYIIDIFSQYQDNILYNAEKAYTYLDKEYAQKRFGDLNAYTQYVKNNYVKFFILDLDKYQKEAKADYTQYTCIDTNGHYYIFKETAPMQYTVILDTYTLELPEFTSKYQQATEEEKVLMNIQKFFEAIEHQDYKYAYNKLDETFKANNFKTQADFEAYVKENFFEQNELAYGNAQKQNDIYMYDITIKDKSGKQTTATKKTFVMQLKEGTDFVMSFGV